MCDIQIGRFTVKTWLAVTSNLNIQFVVGDSSRSDCKSAYRHFFGWRFFKPENVIKITDCCKSRLHSNYSDCNNFQMVPTLTQWLLVQLVQNMVLLMPLKGDLAWNRVMRDTRHVWSKWTNGQNRSCQNIKDSTWIELNLGLAKSTVATFFSLEPQEMLKLLVALVESLDSQQLNTDWLCIVYWPHVYMPIYDVILKYWLTETFHPQRFCPLWMSEKIERGNFEPVL